MATAQSISFFKFRQLPNPILQVITSGMQQSMSDTRVGVFPNIQALANIETATPYHSVDLSGREINNLFNVNVNLVELSVTFGFVQKDDI